MSRSPFHPQNKEITMSLQREIAENPVFSSIEQEIRHLREVNKMRYRFVYPLSNTIAGGATLPFNITIEQGTDFHCQYITGSFFSYDAVNASSFPIPNSLGVTAWAGRGLYVQITDTKASREQSSGFVAVENLFTPGYGLNMQGFLPWNHLYEQNDQIRFDIRNADNALRTHRFEIAMVGYKYVVPAR